MYRAIIGPEHGWLRLNTWKEGLLSRMGHDLLIDIRDFRLIIEGTTEEPWQVRLDIYKHSFHTIEPTSLSEKDRLDIQNNVREHLPSDLRFSGEVRKSSDALWICNGNLAVGKRQTPINMPFQIEGQAAKGKLELSHGALHLTPFKAPFGLMKVKDRVDFSFSLDLGSWFASWES
jgi:hypothetical protein